MTNSLNLIAVHCNDVLLIIYKNSVMFFMQMFENALSVDEDQKKEGILSVLSDKYCRSIIKSTMESPKSVMEISLETKIPISTAYRRIQLMHDAKILSISGSISQDGKKFFMYKSKIKGIQTQFNDGIIDLKIVPNR
jgi:hypothetical protein